MTTLNEEDEAAGIELNPPRTEADSFLIEAALNLGAEHVDDDATIIQMSEVALIELARRVRHSSSLLPASLNAPHGKGTTP